MGSWELPEEPPPPPAEPGPPPQRDWAWTVIRITCVVLCTVLVVGGLLFVGAFVLFAVGMNQMGSNK